MGYFGLGVAVAAAGRGVFGAGCGVRVGWCASGEGGGELVSVFQGIFASIDKILNLAGRLGAGVAHGH